MPLPKPKKDESHDDFIDRCMSDSVMLDEYPDNDQRLAVCETQWESKRITRVTLERRFLPVEDVELRIDSDGPPKITGYIAKYGKWSEDLGGFREKIRKGAFDEALKDGDVRCLKNHDPNLILGRNTSGTLRLSSNSVGLRFECDVPDTTTGHDVVEEIRRKDITGNSFSFTTAEDDWKYLEDGSIERTLIKIDQLFDVGPVAFPAYPDTTVAARSLKQFQKEHPQKPVDSQPSDRSDPSDKEKEQPGVPSPVISAERRRRIEKGYRKAERIINRCRVSDDTGGASRAETPHTPTHGTVTN